MGDPHVDILMRYYYKNEDLMVSEMSRALRSINSQTYKHKTVTFCRDGGLDATPLIERMMLVPYMTMGGSQNFGRGFATNVLLTAVRGKYWMLLDSDDYIEPRYVEDAVAFGEKTGVVMVKPKVKFVRFAAERHDIVLFEQYFNVLMERGDTFYRSIFGTESIKVYSEGLMMISKLFHVCMSELKTKESLNVTEDNYWMYKANRILDAAGLRRESYTPRFGSHYIQVHPLDRMKRYEELGLVMKAEAYYEIPTEDEIERVRDAYAKGL